MTNKSWIFGTLFAKKVKAEEPKVRPALTVYELKEQSASLYAEIEKRIGEDSKNVDELLDRRQNELKMHDQTIRNVMQRHENAMAKLSEEELAIRESIQQAMNIKAAIARIF